MTTFGGKFPIPSQSITLAPGLLDVIYYGNNLTGGASGTTYGFYDVSTGLSVWSVFVAAGATLWSPGPTVLPPGTFAPYTIP